MQDFPLANVLLNIDDFVADYPGIYYTTRDLHLATSPDARRSDMPASCTTGHAEYSDENSCLVFSGAIDFGTYFNALSLGKWMRYTVARSFWLHLELAGDATLVLFKELGCDAEMSCHTTEILAETPASDAYVAYDIELPASFATLVAFSLETFGTARLHNAYYYTKVAESSIRDIRLALCTTTFRKEEFVIPNIEAVKRNVLGSTDPIAEHFHMFVVDNGRTLDAATLEVNALHECPSDWENPKGGLVVLGDESGVQATQPVSTASATGAAGAAARAVHAVQPADAAGELDTMQPASATDSTQLADAVNTTDAATGASVPKPTTQPASTASATGAIQPASAGARAFAGVTVIPNPNVGGSGGFARGMMAALDAGATHALLMDDDVRVFPESFKRAFSLLSLANERYAHAFLNGAMLALEQPNMQYEDVAYIRRVTTYERVKGDIRIDSPLDIVENERIDVEVPNAYGAWWFCCIPTEAIRAHGLPLPLFVRGDDVEYGMRCKPTIMTMNGICVWHAQFEGRWRSSVDCYQFQRNFRIAMACDGECDEFWYMVFFKRAFYSALRGLNYSEAELLLDALEDYAKGPEFLENAPANDLFMEKGRLNERLIPLEEMPAAHKAVLAQAGTPNMEKALDPKATALDRLVWYAGCVFAPLPFNLHMLPDELLRNKPLGVYYTRPMVPLGASMRRRTLVAFDAQGTAASIRCLDRARYGRIMDRWRAVQRTLRTRGPEIERAWRDAQPYLTSREFWEKYLAANA